MRRCSSLAAFSHGWRCVSDPCDLDAILAVAEKHGLPVVEDCAQSHGAVYKGRKAGSIGTIASFSTMSGKHHATAAQGGVVFSKDEALIAEAKRFSDRGKSNGGNVRAGLNLNGNDLAAAVGRVQLRKLASVVERRRQVAAAIASEIDGLSGVGVSEQVEGGESSYWFMLLDFDEAALGVSKEECVAPPHRPSVCPWV